MAWDSSSNWALVSAEEGVRPNSSRRFWRVWSPTWTMATISCARRANFAVCLPVVSPVAGDSTREAGKEDVGGGGGEPREEGGHVRTLGGRGGSPLISGLARLLAPLEAVEVCGREEGGAADARGPPPGLRVASGGAGPGEAKVRLRRKATGAKEEEERQEQREAAFAGAAPASSRASSRRRAGGRWRSLARGWCPDRAFGAEKGDGRREEGGFKRKEKGREAGRNASGPESGEGKGGKRKSRPDVARRREARLVSETMDEEAGVDWLREGGKRHRRGGEGKKVDH